MMEGQDSKKRTVLKGPCGKERGQRGRKAQKKGEFTFFFFFGGGAKINEGFLLKRRT